MSDEPLLHVHQALFSRTIVCSLCAPDQGEELYQLADLGRIQLTHVATPFEAKVTCPLKLTHNSRTKAIYTGRTHDLDGSKLYYRVTLRMDLTPQSRREGLIAAGTVTVRKGFWLRVPIGTDDVDIRRE